MFENSTIAELRAIVKVKTSRGQREKFTFDKLNLQSSKPQVLVHSSFVQFYFPSKHEYWGN